MPENNKGDPKAASRLPSPPRIVEQRSTFAVTFAETLSLV
jgi:hypothetical protein